MYVRASRRVSTRDTSTPNSITAVLSQNAIVCDRNARRTYWPTTPGTSERSCDDAWSARSRPRSRERTANETSSGATATCAAARAAALTASRNIMAALRQPLAGAPRMGRDELPVDVLDGGHARVERQRRLHAKPRAHHALHRLLALAQRVLDRTRERGDVAARHDQPVDVVRDDFRRSSRRRGDHWRFERHRLEDGVRRALVVRRLHEQVAGVVHRDDVVAVAEETARVRQHLRGLRGERVAKAAVSSDHDTQRREPWSGRGARANEQVEALLRLEPADRTDHDVARIQPERRARAFFARSIAMEGAMVDPVQHDAYLCRRRAATDQLGSNPARYGNRDREPRDNSLVERVVEQPLAPAVAGPSVGGRQRDDAFGARDQQRQQIGLVLVPVNDVDAALADDAAQLSPYAAIERVAFDDLDVVDAETPRAIPDAVREVAAVADVADGNLEASAIGARRAHEDRLLGSAARAADASQLENPDRFAHDRVHALVWIASSGSGAAFERRGAAAPATAAHASAPTTDQSYRSRASSRAC